MDLVVLIIMAQLSRIRGREWASPGHRLSGPKYVASVPFRWSWMECPSCDRGQMSSGPVYSVVLDGVARAVVLNRAVKRCGMPGGPEGMTGSPEESGPKGSCALNGMVKRSSSGGPDKRGPLTDPKVHT